MGNPSIAWLENRAEYSNELARIRKYIAAVEWRFAKSMPTVPHCYTVKAWNAHLAGEFEWFVQFIRDVGIVQPWGRYRNSYLYVDGLKYWTMGAPIADTILINRADPEV